MQGNLMQKLAELIYAVESVQSKGSCLARRFETSCSLVRNTKCQILTLEVGFLRCSHFSKLHNLWPLICIYKYASKLSLKSEYMWN